jgi:cysteine desulfurase/selenocysteine lyase
MVTVLDVHKIRAQFPILLQKIGRYPLIYFDSGATSEKPQFVIDRMNKYYREENANIHRGVHHLSQVSTSNFEQVRELVKSQINARHAHEIIFTSGTTDSINLVASSFGQLLKKGDEVLITQMEHHSNIVPWHMLAERADVVVRYIPLTPSGELDMKKAESLISEKTKLASFVHISNSLGTINPIAELIRKVHAVGGKVLVDAAQSLQHMPMDVQQLDCDFLAFSGHKIFGPTGTGVLYGKEYLLNSMPPYRGGGDMIKTVSMEKTVYNDLPHKFEAGTPNISGVIGFGAALEWLNSLDREQVIHHENELLNYATEKLNLIEGMCIIGTAKEKSGVLSFVIDGLHHSDIGTLLNQQGIAVRTGHHCTQPVMDYFKIPGTVRASFSLYNTLLEIDIFAEALKKAVKILRG